MSYCRYGVESDVYLYQNLEGGWVLNGDRVKTREKVLKKLYEIRGAGHKVPQEAIDRIEAEIAKEAGK